MADFIHQFTDPLIDDDLAYAVRIFAEPVGNLWQAWIEFHPLDGGPTLRTDLETEQSNRLALSYWATGLSAIYLQGAFERALPVTSASPSMPIL